MVTSRTQEGETTPATSADVSERERVLAEHARRKRELPSDLYAPWQPAEMLHRHTRRRAAAHLLRSLDQFPDRETVCLEIGCGSGGWLLDLQSWGCSASRLIGVEIDPSRARDLAQRQPALLVVLADGSKLPLRPDSCDLVVLSTVLSSVLDGSVRQDIAHQVETVLRPGGCLLFYDFRVPSPRNPNVQPMTRRALRHLFPTFEITARSVTLAPPLARRLARAPALCEALEMIPFLRTHLLAVLRPPTS